MRPNQPTRVPIELSGGTVVRGEVRSGDTPLAGLKVEAKRLKVEAKSWDNDSRKTATTSAEGNFVLEGVAPGRCQIEVTGEDGDGGTVELKKWIRVSPTQPSLVRFSLSRIELTGRVTSKGMPVADATVKAASVGRGWSPGPAETEASGHYALRLPATGAYTVHVRTDAGVTCKTEVEVPPGLPRFEHDIEVPAGQLDGVVVDATSGTPIEKIHVIARLPRASPSYLSYLLATRGAAMTDEEGRFVIRGLAPGEYDVGVFGDGYAHAALGRFVAAEIAGEIKLALAKGRLFRARITDRDGKPIEDCVATLIDEQGRFLRLIYGGFLGNRVFIYPEPSNRDGVLDMDGLRPGPCHLRFAHSEFAPAETTFQVGAVGMEGNVVLTAGGRVTVAVVDPRGQPVEDARIEIRDRRGRDVTQWLVPFLPAFSESDGSVVLEHAMPGVYRVIASREQRRSAEESITVTEGGAVSATVTLPD